ncbi:MAG: hypothetical protein ABEK50_14910, partial [bacterium]
MNLAVDLTSLHESWGGMQYFTANFVRSLLLASDDRFGLVHSGEEVRRVRPPHLDDSHQFIEVSSPLGSRVFREQSVLPFELFRSDFDPDRLLVPAYFGPIVSPYPVDMIVYDFLYLRSDSGLSLKNRLYWKGLYKAAFWRADRLYPCSQTTKEEILNRMPWASDKVGPVLYPGHRSYDRAGPVSCQLNRADPYILFVG